MSIAGARKHLREAEGHLQFLRQHTASNVHYGAVNDAWEEVKTALTELDGPLTPDTAVPVTVAERERARETVNP